MKTITHRYRRENETLHDQPGYGSSGHLWLGHILEILEAIGYAETVLDYGCGKGTLKPYLERLGYKVTNYDPATFPKKPKGTFDLVVCLDVLEHIEPECLRDVLEEMYRYTSGLFFAVVSTRPATKTLSDGRNAHLIIEKWPWWKEHLHDGGLWRGVRTREHADYFDYVGRPSPPNGVPKHVIQRIRGKG